MKKIPFVVLLIILLPLSSWATVRQWAGTEYISDQSVTFTWDVVSDADHYESKIVWIDPTNPFEYDLGSVTINEIMVNMPRVGHFICKVRACNESGCSDWSESIDEAVATVDGQPGVWRIFFKMPAPEGLIIETYPEE